jgi:hypothetical protein
MQIIGNPASCWELIAHASRTIVALGYHNIVDPQPRCELDEEIHAVVAWCAQFDSVMSLLLLRPRSLPPLNVRPSSLMRPDPTNPMSIFEILAMELVPVYNKILDLTLDMNAKRPIPSLKDEVAWLRSRMADIFALMQKVLMAQVGRSPPLHRLTNFRSVHHIFLKATRSFFFIGEDSSLNTFPP